MAHRIGAATAACDRPPAIAAWATAVGRHEREGPLGRLFDLACDDATFGRASWEKSESELVRRTMGLLLDKSGRRADDLDCVLAGDLLNQCVASTYGLRSFGIPVLGLYSACSTISEALALGALLLDGGAAGSAAACASSHFCTAERQYRSPLEYGCVRPPTAQWTATACGAYLLAHRGEPPYVRAVTFGTIEDLGVTDQNNMGAAMAPAAAETLRRFFADTALCPADFDAIVTGDLGAVGSELLCSLADAQGTPVRDRHADCGLLLFDRGRQDVHAGGSGAGCSAAVLAAVYLPQMRRGSVNNLLFLATGALLSPTTVQQGETIPAISHLVWLSTSPAPFAAGKGAGA